ncbi:MAG: nucleotidyltransferase family protein [Candidatus Heimdallarchaeota archaeon]|nr:MAG: nucleotidyltransferase family protein [Candidatus Heimdallarchaeota archaeon]
MKNKDIHKYTIEFTKNFWLNLVEVAGHGNVKQFIIQALKVALEAHTIKSLILCGGRGTSFRPISVATPAVMLPIGYKPIIEYSIDLLHRHALTEIFLSVGYLKEHIQQQFSEKKIPGINISFIAEEKPLDTAGAVLNAQKQFKSTFIVMNGDLITNINLNALVEFHRRRIKEGGIATMFVLKNSSGQVDFNEKDNKVTRFISGGKKGLEFINAGIYVFEPEIFNHIEKEVSSLEKDVFPALAKEGLLFGYLPELPVYWNHINSPEKYKKGWADFIAGKLDF